MKLLLLVLLPVIAQAQYDKACVDKSGNPTSSKPFRIPYECNGFYQCSNGHLTSQKCAAGTVFNPKLRVCDSPNNVPYCLSPRWRREVICEHNSKVLSCPAGEDIWVKRAVYGRANSATCPSSQIKTTTCAAAGSLVKIRSNCNGKNSCTVTASNTVFGDPCVGTFKYVEMIYVCRPNRWKTVTVCEGNSKTLSCGKNQAIMIKSGYYGRSDGATCPHKSIKTTSCAASGSFRSLRRTCQGKNTCTVAANNGVFGDPCVGTYKYVKLTYTCRSKLEFDWCNDRKGNPISSDPFWKPFDCRNFYQCSNGILYTMPCGQGTSFSPTHGVCVHSHDVPGCS